MYKWIAGNFILKPVYFLLGEPVLSYLKQFEKTQWLSPNDLKHHQTTRYRNLVRYAYDHIPYYRKMIIEKEINLDDMNDLKGLMSFPILTKDIIQKYNKELISDLDCRKSFRKTSGSTGEPLVMAKDRVATGVMNAVMWRNYRWCGIEMGDRQARIWAGPVKTSQKYTVKISDFLQNRIRFSTFSMNQQTYSDFLEKMMNFRPQYLYGYSQFLYHFATYVMKKKHSIRHLNLKAIIATAEMLFDNQKELIEETFQVKVINEYGSTETGVIAMECPHGKMHLMADNLMVEAVKDGKQVPDGEEGELLITELYSSLTPLIRYRIGDRGVLSRKPCSCGRGLPVLERLVGRTTDVISCRDGTVIDPYLVESILKANHRFYKNVKQWKIHQLNQHKVLITLCMQDPGLRCDVETYLKEEFWHLSSKQLDVEFSYENWLQPELSGKTKVFSVDRP